MNNKEFIAALAQKSGYSQADTQRLVSALADAMAAAFDEGDSVSMPSFGYFEVKKRLERIAVNPKTQQRMLVPPKLVLNFRPASAVKEPLKNGGESHG